MKRGVKWYKVASSNESYADRGTGHRDRSGISFYIVIRRMMLYEENQNVFSDIEK